jgi:hypothetical protein
MKERDDRHQGDNKHHFDFVPVECHGLFFFLRLVSTKIGVLSIPGVLQFLQDE